MKALAGMLRRRGDGEWADGFVQIVAAIAIVTVMLFGGLGRAEGRALPTDGGVHTLIHPWVVQTECGNHAVAALVTDGRYRVDMIAGHDIQDCRLVAVFGIMPGFEPGEFAWTFANTGIASIGRAPSGEWARPGVLHPHVAFDVNHAVGTVAVSLDLAWLFQSGEGATLTIGMRSGADRNTQVYSPQLILIDQRRAVPAPAGQQQPFRPHLVLPDDGGRHEILRLSSAEVACPNGAGYDRQDMYVTGRTLEAPNGISRVHHADCLVYLEWRPEDGYLPRDVIDSFARHDGLASVAYPDGTEYIRLSSQRPGASVGVNQGEGTLYMWMRIAELMRGQSEVAVTLSTRHGAGQTILTSGQDRVIFHW
ncbi:MAG: hypothetical protein RLO50_06665 [Azospirillaceae bacterium]